MQSMKAIIPQGISRRMEKSLIKKGGVYNNKVPRTQNNSELRMQGDPVRDMKSNSVHQKMLNLYSEDETYNTQDDTDGQEMYMDMSVINETANQDMKDALIIPKTKFKPPQRDASNMTRQDYHKLNRHNLIALLKLANQKLRNANLKIDNLTDIEHVSSS